MKRQQESAEADDADEYEDERPTRLDIVRRQGEQQLRKVSLLIESVLLIVMGLVRYRCVNKSWLVSRSRRVEKHYRKWS